MTLTFSRAFDHDKWESSASEPWFVAWLELADLLRANGWHFSVESGLWNKGPCVARIAVAKLK